MNRAYIQSLVAPTTKKQAGRKVWSIDLETTIVPFLTATNTMGDTNIESSALGCPLQVAYDKSGSVRFAKNGKPVIRVAKEISVAVADIRNNLIANLQAYTGDVINGNTEAYKASVEANRKAGEPIAQKNLHDVSEAMKAKAQAEADAILEASQQEVTTPEAIPA